MIIHDVELSLEAQEDLEEIHDYIATELENPLSASRIINSILNKCQSLSVFPRGYAVRYKIEGRALRTAHIGHYTIIFHIDTARKAVLIESIVYSRRNIDAIYNS